MRILKIMPRNFNKIVRSWTRLQEVYPPYMSWMLNVVELCTETFNYSYLHINYYYMLCILCIKLRTFYTSIICNGFCSDHSPKSCMIACFKNNPFYATITAWKASKTSKINRVFLRVLLGAIPAISCFAFFLFGPAYLPTIVQPEV